MLVDVPLWSNRDAVVSLVLRNLVLAPGVNGVPYRPDQMMADQWHRSKWVERSLTWWHPSFTSGTAHAQEVVVSLLLSEDAVQHGANSLSFCPSLPSAHLPPLWAVPRNTGRIMVEINGNIQLLILVGTRSVVCRIKTGSGGICCHNARGRVRNRKSNPDGVAGGIWRTVRTSPSALWQQTPTDRS